jgi:hypothetical protein
VGMGTGVGVGTGMGMGMGMGMWWLRTWIGAFERNCPAAAGSCWPRAESPPRNSRTVICVATRRSPDTPGVIVSLCESVETRRRWCFSGVGASGESTAGARVNWKSWGDRHGCRILTGGSHVAVPGPESGNRK